MICCRPNGFSSKRNIHKPTFFGYYWQIFFLLFQNLIQLICYQLDVKSIIINTNLKYSQLDNVRLISIHIIAETTLPVSSHKYWDASSLCGIRIIIKFIVFSNDKGFKIFCPN